MHHESDRWRGTFKAEKHFRTLTQRAELRTTVWHGPAESHLASNLGRHPTLSLRRKCLKKNGESRDRTVHNLTPLVDSVPDPGL